MRLVQSKVEQFLYLVLLAVFVALVAGILTLVHFNNDLQTSNRGLKNKISQLESKINNQKPTEDAIKTGTDTIICMLLVPQAQRTTDVAENCRKQVEILQQKTPQAIQVPQSSKPAQVTPMQKSSTPDNTPVQPSPPNNQPEQPKKPLDCTIDLLTVHLGCP